VLVFYLNLGSSRGSFSIILLAFFYTAGVNDIGCMVLDEQTIPGVIDCLHAC
jgi:hypothetical protein